MPNLKLPKLPERAPIKITIAVNPDLYRTLQAYAALYRQAYGEEEELSALVPSMLEQFLNSDREFSRARRASLTPKSKL